MTMTQKLYHVTCLLRSRWMRGEFAPVARSTLSATLNLDASGLEPGAESNIAVSPDGFYVYSPKLPWVKNSASLLEVIRDAYPRPVTNADLSDTYDGVETDLKQLIMQGSVCRLVDNESGALFFAVPFVTAVDVDQDIADMFRDIEIPESMSEMCKALRTANLRPKVEHSRVVEQTLRPPRKRKRSGVPRKLTNEHLRSTLFETQNRKK